MRLCSRIPSVSEGDQTRAHLSSSAMEANFCSQPQPDFDLGYFSTCSSSFSPTSSVDYSCFSPPVHQFRAGSDQQKLNWTSPAWDEPSAAQIKRRSRSKKPGKKRQSASEREKLRMRDLTKALHHLRGFLPPSVAPTGQTLTKIETLRLTISYITCLSSQLGLEESSSQAGDFSKLQGGFLDTWSPNDVQKSLQNSGQHCQTSTVFTSSAQQMETSTKSTVYYKDTRFPQIPNQTSQIFTHCDLTAL